MGAITTPKRQAQQMLASLRTRAWVQACKKSLMLQTGDQQPVTHYQLSKAANHGTNKPNQATRWKQWDEGAPATARTAHQVDAAPDLTGAAGAYLTGPWVDIGGVVASGAYVPLWNVIEGDTKDIVTAWKQVPNFAWRHWCIWEGMALQDFIALGLMTAECYYPPDDFHHPQFKWQVNLAKQLSTLEEKREQTYNDVLQRVFNRTYEDDPGKLIALLVNTVFPLEKEYSDFFEMLGRPRDGFDPRMKLLVDIEQCLQKLKKGHEEQHQEEYELLLHDCEQYLLAAWHEGPPPAAESMWVPKLKTGYELFSLLKQCLEYGSVTPPLVALAAGISVVKMAGGSKHPATIDGTTYPYTLWFADDPGDMEVDACHWDEVNSQLEEMGISMDQLIQAAKGFGVYIGRKRDRDEILMELEREAQHELG